MVVFLGMLAIAVSTVLALFLGLVGLLEAPWQVLLGMLLIALYGIQRVSAAASMNAVAVPHQDAHSEAIAPDREAGEKNTAPEDQADEETMTYRGVPYQSKPDTSELAADDSADTIKLEGVYRGCHWQKSVPARLQPQETDPHITYRGKKIRATPPYPTVHRYGYLNAHAGQQQRHSLDRSLGSPGATGLDRLCCDRLCASVEPIFSRVSKLMHCIEAAPIHHQPLQALRQHGNGPD